MTNLFKAPTAATSGGAISGSKTNPSGGTSPDGFPAILEVETEKNEKGFVDYYIKTPFNLKEQLSKAYEDAKSRGVKVFRKWDGERRKWKCSKAWVEICAEMVTGGEPAQAVRRVPAEAPRARTFDELFSEAKTLLDQAIAAATPETPEASVKKLTQAKAWMAS